MHEIRDISVLYKILRMYYIDNFNQREIGEKMNISRIKVNRHITYARNNNLVEIRLNIPMNENTQLEFAIEKKFGLNECRVVDTSSNRDNILRQMAEELTKILDRVVKKNSYLGISWGTTIEAMANNVHVKKKKDLKVVPLSGGGGLEGSASFANFVTKAMADKFNGISYMINVPAILDTKEAKEIIKNDNNTKNLINLAKKVSVALVGMGKVSRDMSLCEVGVLKKQDVDHLIALGVIGMVNMTCVDKDGNHVPNKVDERMINIYPKNSLKKANTCIGVGFGDNKIDVIRAALKGKLIKTLITDENTAEKILMEI
jgi:deoxyribonucleoside regulator